MMAVFNGMVKGKEKEGGGHYWNAAGFTLFESMYEGKRQLSMLDARSGVRVSFFLIDRGQGTQKRQSASGGGENAQGRPFNPDEHEEF